MSQVLQKLEFSIGSFGQHRSREWFHNLLHGNGLTGQLILCRALYVVREATTGRLHVCPYQTRPKAPIPTGCKSVYLILKSVRLFFVRTESCVPAGDLECSPKNLGAYELRHLVRLFGSLSNQTMAMREGRGFR